MPVFISHRTADDGTAQSIGNYLYTNFNIRCYLDHFDPEARTTKDITNLIVNRIRDCTHLMAVITNSTVGSWWVPFEIGVARQSNRRITSFDASSLQLPEFLQEWPVMETDDDLDLFAEAYHRDNSARPLVEKYAQANRRIISADDFHERLKRAIHTGVLR